MRVKTLLGLCAAWLVLGCSQMKCPFNRPAGMDLSGQSDASIRNVITRVAHHQIRELRDGDYREVSTVAAAQAARPPEGIGWDYPWGVALYGMLRVSDATGDKTFEHFVVKHNQIVARDYEWLTKLLGTVAPSAETRGFVRSLRLRRLILLGSLDNCGAMGSQLVETFLNHGVQPTAEQKQIGETIANYIGKKQARLPDGTLWRPERFGGTVWVDDLYMSCPFLVRWYKYTGSREHLDDAARQIINMSQRLQDADGVWWHGYFENDKQHSVAKWGRGNGWAMVTTVEVLSAMPEDHPDRAKLLEILRRHIEGIKRLQASDGMWRQILDRPELWEETSCTAMFSYSIARAVNRGWIDPSNMAVARKAFAGLCKNVTPEGAVNGTCEGTSIGEDVDSYVERARPDDDMHGRGPVMLAGAEILSAKGK